MCTEKDKGLVPYSEITRRNFTALAAGAAVAGLAGRADAAMAIERRDVQVRTPDGTCDAALIHPAGTAQYPGVLFWPDAGGLRASMRDMGARLAGHGYAVLVVNPYYRTGTAASLVTPPAAPGTPPDPAAQARRQAMRAAMTDDAIDRDAAAFVAYLDALPQTSNAKVGVQGYCMGGPLSFRTAAAVPSRVGAVGSFHGGGLVTENPNSPHLLIEKSNARYLVAIAKNDDERQPAAKTVLTQTFQRAGKPAVVDVYAGNHGWTVPDNGSYLQPEAERAWSALQALYREALV